MNIQAIAQQAAARKAAAVANLQDAKREALSRYDELTEAQRENKQAAQDRSEERALVEGHALDLFPTPPELAARMVELCNEPLYDGALWLEPSAGTGRIAQAMRDAGHEPNCIELNYNAAELLKKRGFNVDHADFLECSATETVKEPGRIILPLQADVICMNPPFSNGQDVKHVRHALECLSEGGRLVAIMSAGPKARAFCDEMGVYPEELPAGTFKASGTMVAALLVVIDK